jgi:hypothetical protein
MSGIRVITAFDGQDAGIVLSSMENDVYGKKYPYLDMPSQLTWVPEKETKGEFFLRMEGMTDELRKNIEGRERIDNENHVKNKPYGYWDTEFTQNGIRYRIDHHEKLEKIRKTPFNENLIVKMNYTGIVKSDPTYIYKIIIIVKYPYGKKEKDFLEQTRDLCKWLILNDQVDVHIVKYEDILNSQKNVEKHLNSILNTGMILFDGDLPEEKHSPENVIEKVCQCMRDKDFETAYEVCLDELEERWRASRTWKCRRTDKKTTEEQCKLCIKNVDFRDNLKKRAIKSNVDWAHQPCMFECGKDLDGEPITFEASIKNNFWV